MFENKQLHTIVKRSLGGDLKLRKVLYGHVAPMMLSVAYRYANNKPDAEDIFQESVLNVFDRLHQLRDAEKIHGWAKIIVVNEAIRFYKKKRNMVFTEETLPETAKYEGDSDIYKHLELEQILKIIQQLPDKMRMVINLYAIEGFKHEEISGMLGISVGTSKSNLHDARKQIKNFMKEEMRKLG
ncbi:MAG: sigma-70 family RNA polymerase sigma factor [Draconibacterium sp.]|nr:sigma-70 family RNA polymerase sigma factor [Draconibacterium sp.]